jgi:hypothetical protein
MSIDQRVVEGDACVRGRDVADAAHVGGEVIHLIHAFGCCDAVIIDAQIQLKKFVGGRGLKFRKLDVGTTNKIAFAYEFLDEMVADEPTCSGNEHDIFRIRAPFL